MILRQMMLFISLLIEATHSARRRETAQQRLVRNLMNGYIKDLRPVWDTDSVTNVTINPALHSIVDTDDASESVTIVLWYRMLWNDVFLQWNPDDYGGLRELFLPVDSIWIDVDNLVPDDKNYAIIDNHGNVLMAVDQMITFHCEYRIAHFPFDTQNCTIHTASWMHNAAQIDIFPMTPTDLGPYNKNAEWNLISMTSRKTHTIYGISDTPFVDVYYDLVIERKSSYYVTTFLIPSFIITALAIVGIFGPFNDSVDREEKITMGLTTLLTMAVILLLVNEDMPKSSGSMPLLGLSIILQISLSAFASLTSVFVMSQHNRWTKGDPLPKWITNLTWMPRDDSKATVGIRDDDHIKCVSSTTNDDSSSQASHHTNTIIDRLIVEELRSTLTPVNSALKAHDHEEELRLKWTTATRRLDLVFMFLFNLLHVIITVAILAYGFSRRGVSPV